MGCCFSIDRLRQLAQQVAAKADALILLSHLGLPRDEQIAAEIAEIDVIIGAHTHHVLPHGKRISGKLIAQAGKHGQYLGKLSLEFAEGSHEFLSAEEELLDPGILMRIRVRVCSYSRCKQRRKLL